MHEELSEYQCQTFLAYHFEGKTMAQIAAERGVNRSTVLRTLRRAERKVRRITQYI